MSAPADEPRAFGFTRAEWVRSGAFTEAKFDRLLATLARGENTVVAHSGWIQLAGLGPEYARAVWDRFGAAWSRTLETLQEAGDTGSVSLGGEETLARFRTRVAQNIAEVRRLAGLDGAEPSSDV